MLLPAIRRPPPGIRLPARLGALAAIATMLLLASGCATPPKAGPIAETTPPRLIEDADGTVIWDSPYAFQRVPKALRDAGNQACRAAGIALAAGYHPYARDLAGQQISGGGYFCIERAAIWPLRSSAQDQATATANPSSVP